MDKQIPSPVTGAKYGNWELKKELSRGMNGQVWVATDDKGQECAIKLLMKLREIPLKRFRDEISAMKSNSDIPGILPVIDCDVPTDPTERRAWFAMPVASPLAAALQTATVRRKVDAVRCLAETMASLHERGVVHRDIKPRNLLMYQRRPHIGDFGLVDFPEKEDLTQEREELGPRWTMAPEIRRLGQKAEARPADVYSLAKSLWILITGVEEGFEGQYAAGGTIGLSHFVGDLYVTSLEDLLLRATDHVPSARPTMGQFAEELRNWVMVSGHFRKYNRLQWADLLSRLFPVVAPTRGQWHEIVDIVSILNVLGKTPDLNHMLLPGGGGLDLDSAAPARTEEGCIELTANGLVQLVKPKVLSFESFGHDPQWNYFRLETVELAESGVNPGISNRWKNEEVTDLGNGKYIDRGYWDEGEYEGRPLPSGARCLTRVFRGSFVIVQKTSIYNSVPGTYDGRHSSMDADEFRNYIRVAAEACKQASEEKKQAPEGPDELPKEENRRAPEDLASER